MVGTDVPEADLREAMSPHIVSIKYYYNNIFNILKNVKKKKMLKMFFLTFLLCKKYIICIHMFQLGVNNYAFIVTNNGFIVTHPDLRPVVR